MKTVQPIRDEKKIEAMKKILKGKSLRDYAFFTLGINTGLRISDILNFTFEDVLKGVSSGNYAYNDKEEKYTGFYTVQRVRTDPHLLQKP